DAFLRFYDRGLRFVFRHQFSMLVATLLLMCATAFLYLKIPFGFFPQQDTGFIFGQAEARQDTSFTKMAGLVHQLDTMLRKDVATGARLTRTQYQYTLTDTNREELNHWAPIVEAAMQKLPELQDVASDQQIAAPHISIEIDRDVAARLGISASLIDETLYDAFGQRQVATMYTATNQYKVILEVQPQFQDDPNALTKIYVSGPNGVQLPLSSFARFTSKVESLSISHQGQFPAVTLSFKLAPGYS